MTYVRYHIHDTVRWKSGKCSRNDWFSSIRRRGNPLRFVRAIVYGIRCRRTRMCVFRLGTNTEEAPESGALGLLEDCQYVAP